MTHRITRMGAALLAVLGLPSLPAIAADAPVLNVYSARHYRTDEALYAGFTEQTGIRVQRIEGKEDELLERLKNEGAASPADVLITVDAARLAKADALGLFAPVESPTLAARIPAYLRTPTWIAFSTRARIIVYAKDSMNPADVASYESLADPKLKGKVCTRPGAHPYNLSLMAGLISHLGEAKATEWVQGLVANFARPPRGGDTDQIKAVAAGECGVAISNSYYLARLMRSDKPEDQAVVAKVGMVWPNQASYGTHINVSGAGVLKHAPNREAAVKFLEYLASDRAQVYFADGNNEWPAVAEVKIDNPALAKLGPFKPDTQSVGVLAANQAEALKIFDRAGFR